MQFKDYQFCIFPPEIAEDKSWQIENEDHLTVAKGTTPGEALDNLIKWATGRGLIVCLAGQAFTIRKVIKSSD